MWGAMTASEYQQLIEFLGRRFETIDRRFETIDRRFDGIDGQFAVFGGRFDALDQRFDAFEQRVEDRFQEVFGHFDEVYRRLENLEQEYYAVTQALRRIEALLADEVGRREILERGLDELKRQVASLQARIDAVEQRLRQ
jgi:chaperonin cofactor prefoldin